MEYKIESEFLEVIVSSNGCEIISAKTKDDKKEHIWQGNPAVWKRHAPILFPLVGKYKNNVSVYQGKPYEMTQHGFARDMVFTLVEQRDDLLVMKLEDTEETLDKYPFGFELFCTYEIKDKTINAGWKVVNKNDCQMYFSIGGHPAFICDGKDTMADCELLFETETDELSYRLLNADGLLNDSKYTMKLSNKKVRVTKDFFDKDAYVFENSHCRSVSVQSEGKTVVKLTFDSPVFGLWSQAERKVPFICIEPWYGRTDRSNFCGTLADREYQNTLQAGQSFQKEYKIEF